MKRRLFAIIFILFAFWGATAKTKGDTLRLWDYLVKIDIPENAIIKYNPYEEGLFVLIYDPYYTSIEKEGDQMTMPPLITLFIGGLTRIPLIDTSEASEYHKQNTHQRQITYGVINNLYFKEIEDRETHIRLCYQYVPIKKLRKYNHILNKVRIRKIIDDPN